MSGTAIDTDPREEARAIEETLAALRRQIEETGRACKLLTDIADAQPDASTRVLAEKEAAEALAKKSQAEIARLQQELAASQEATRVATHERNEVEARLRSMLTEINRARSAIADLYLELTETQDIVKRFQRAATVNEATIRRFEEEQRRRAS